MECAAVQVAEAGGTPGQNESPRQEATDQPSQPAAEGTVPEFRLQIGCGGKPLGSQLGVPDSENFSDFGVVQGGGLEPLPPMRQRELR